MIWKHMFPFKIINKLDLTLVISYPLQSTACLPFPLCTHFCPLHTHKHICPNNDDLICCMISVLDQQIWTSFIVVFSAKLGLGNLGSMVECRIKQHLLKSHKPCKTFGCKTTAATKNKLLNNACTRLNINPKKNMGPKVGCL